MRLKSIKLAGFKSFVDPTTVNFPGNMCAVVGPNGCGKSNVIDAVRWVMGESSAKHLRGDSMTDVIFNGSTSRKPVGQATVELLFDNIHQSIPVPTDLIHAGEHFVDVPESFLRRHKKNMTTGELPRTKLLNLIVDGHWERPTRLEANYRRRSKSSTK